MRKAIVSIAVIASFGLAFYFFLQTFSGARSSTAVMTIPEASRLDPFTLSILFFSVAVASVFYYLSIQQNEQGQSFRRSSSPGSTEAGVSDDGILEAVTRPAKDGDEAPRKERYFVDEDFSEAQNKNRF